MKPRPQSSLCLEGAVEHPDPVGGGRAPRPSAARGSVAPSPAAAAEQHLVEAPELADRPVAVAARRAADDVGLAVPAAGAAASEALGLGAVHLADARRRRRAKRSRGMPTHESRHAQGLEDLLAHVAAKVPAVEAPHHLAEDEPARAQVVARLLARLPARLGPRPADVVDDLLPARLRPADVEQPDAAGVGQHVAQGDPVLAAGAELRQVAGDRIVELEEARAPTAGRWRRRRPAWSTTARSSACRRVIGCPGTRSPTISSTLWPPAVRGRRSAV